MNPVVHFELPYLDRDRAERFYATVFGWKTQFLGPDMGDYVLLTTAETDVKSSAPAGAINGGMFPARHELSGGHPSIVIGVDDLEHAMTRVQEMGGKILGAPHPIADVGSIVPFIDSEGSRLSMLEPSRG